MVHISPLLAILEVQLPCLFTGAPRSISGIIISTAKFYTAGLVSLKSAIYVQQCQNHPHQQKEEEEKKTLANKILFMLPISFSKFLQVHGGVFVCVRSASV